jgi:hypothetical protein
LIIARYPGSTLARLYRVSYDASYNVTGATLLGNGNFGPSGYTANVPLVDITSAHLP